jgi:hypothetical protein
MEVVPYQPRHLREIALQPHQEHLGTMLQRTDAAEQVTKTGPCWTALLEGKPIACAGFQNCWEGRAIAWAVLSDQAGPHMLSLTRAVRKALELYPAERIEAHAMLGFRPAERWLKALGFEQETVLRKFNRGQDFRAFVLLKTTL